MHWIVILALVVFGLIFGSFVNALAWRFHSQAELAKKSKKAVAKARAKKTTKQPELSAAQLSMLKGRSMCSHCHHELAPKDLVPLFSWLWLRGKCRYCHVKIEDNPLIEVFLPVLFVISYVSWPLSLHGVGLFQFATWLVFLVAFMALASYDLRWYILPDRIVFPLVALAAIEAVVVAVLNHHLAGLWQPLVGAVIIFGFFWLLFQVSNGSWIGGGDVKLGLVLGLLAGTPFKAVLVIFLASLIGTIGSSAILLKGRKGLKTVVPFGPYLLLGMFIVMVYGDRIINWYEGLLRV